MFASKDDRVCKWRELARQAMIDMERSSDPDVKAIFQSIACEYTVIADMTEAQRLKLVASPKPTPGQR